MMPCQHVPALAATVEHSRLCSAGRAMLEDVLARIAPLSPTPRMAILLYGRDEAHRVAAAVGLPPEYVQVLGAVAGEGRPFLETVHSGRARVCVCDVASHASSRLREAARMAGVRALWSVPVEADGLCAGELTWHLETLQELPVPEQAWAVSVGRLIGALIDQHQVGQHCDRGDEPFLLQDITSSLLGAETPVDVALALLQWARRCLGASGGLVLWHRHGEDVEVLAADGLDAEDAGDHAVWIEAFTHARTPVAPPLRPAPGGKTRLLLPLAAGTTVAALLELVFPPGYQPDSATRDLLAAACTTSAQALERARSHEAERKAAARIGLMAEAARVLSEASLDLDIVLDAFARMLVGALADGCIVRLFSDDNGWLETSCVHDRTPEVEDVLRRSLLGRRSRARSALADAVVSTGVLVTDAPALFNEWGDTLRPEELEELNGLPCDVTALAPLRVEQRVLGWLAVSRSRPAQPFSADDLAVLRELASRAALAIDNARLHRDSVRAVQIRDDFVSVAGHELKTPLTALHLQAHMLVKTAASSSPRIRLHGERILQQAARLARLVDELLDVSRIASGRLQIDCEQLDLRALVLDVTHRLGGDFERAGCELIIDAKEPAPGRWDRLRIDQVLTNLMSNALKYGAGKPIAVTLRRQRNSVLLVVEDHGIGIAPEDQIRIFERFERAVSARRFGGLGLGLWIARQIVEAHGGSISVVSYPGRGSAFKVELPTRLSAMTNA